MTKKALKKLKSKLPKNGSELIHVKTGFTISYINMVLAGTKFNQDIINAAIEIAAEHQEKLKNQTNRIESL